MNLAESLKHYFETTPPEKIQSDWDKTEQFDKFGVSVEEFLRETENFKKLQAEGKICPSCFKQWNKYCSNAFHVSNIFTDIKRKSNT